MGLTALLLTLCGCNHQAETWFLHQLPLQVLMLTTITDAGKQLLIGRPSRLTAAVCMMD
jgi:hypothetical protein